jgi:hypothetical protein
MPPLPLPVGHSLTAAVDQRPGPAPGVTACSWMPKRGVELLLGRLVEKGKPPLDGAAIILCGRRYI